MDKRQASPELSRIDQLPDDVLLLILSFLPNLREIARSCILSMRWRNLWHSIPRLDFNCIPLLPEKLLMKSHDWYKAWVNKVLAIPRSSLVKELRIQYELTAMDSPHIDTWIDFAVANRVENLHLEFAHVDGYLDLDDQYQLSEEHWYRAPSGISSLRCLKSLSLFHVTVSKQFIEFILSTCSLLEDLWLESVGDFTNLDVSSLQLRHLTFNYTPGIALNTLCAPHLTSFSFYSLWDGFDPQKIDTPMLTDLTIGATSGPQSIMGDLKHFWPYLPQLEKLDLIMEEELVKLKYLRISLNSDTDSFWHQIAYFLNACPVLETFAFQITYGNRIPNPYSIVERSKMEQENEVLRQIERRLLRHYLKIQARELEDVCSGFKCLKVLELHAGFGKVIDQELVKYIIRKSPNLEKLIIDTRLPSRYPELYSSQTRFIEAAKAKAEKLCSPAIEICIVG